jgi:hypothetical protein
MLHHAEDLNNEIDFIISYIFNAFVPWPWGSRGESKGAFGVILRGVSILIILKTFQRRGQLKKLSECEGSAVSY